MLGIFFPGIWRVAPKRIDMLVTEKTYVRPLADSKAQSVPPYIKVEKDSGKVQKVLYPPVLMPPQMERYIKARNYDCL